MTKARECGSKQQHKTRQAARDHLWALIRSGTRPGAMSVYRCHHCKTWHVGHRKRARR